MLFAMMMSAMSVEEEGRFLELYDEYHALVYYIAYEILEDRNAAEEAEQETFLKVIQNFKLFAGGICSYSKNLIAVMAKNTAIDFWRKRNSDSRLEQYLLQGTEDEEGKEDTEYQSQSAEEMYLEQMTAEKLAEAVKKLPQKECRAIELRYYNHLKIKEIAVMMEVSEEAVKKLIQRGLADLRKQLGTKDIA